MCYGYMKNFSAFSKVCCEELCVPYYYDNENSVVSFNIKNDKQKLQKQRRWV